MFALSVQLQERPSDLLWSEVSTVLFQLGAQGIDEGEEAPPEGEAALIAGDEFEQAIHPGVLSPPDAFVAYFQTHELCLHAWQAIAPLFDTLCAQFQVEAVEEKDYDAIWKASFKPLHCAPHWLIRAPWHTPEDLNQSTHERELIIEPGMAFGTGTHETTQSCLEFLSTVVKPGNKVLDFGCGSGILAIAAKILGAGDVWAVDIDPLAIEASRHNAARNQVALTVALEAPQFKESLDVVVANILKNTLLDFATYFAASLKSHGHLILSGLLLEQESIILNHYKQTGFMPFLRIQKGEWVSLCLVRGA